MTNHIPFVSEPDVIPSLIGYLADNDMRHLHLVADKNTYAALGQAVEEALKAADFDLITTILQGKEVVTDAHYAFQVLLDADRVERVYLAVGSGTITDITRVVSHRTRTVFVSLPSAPSVDGFTSPGAPTVVDGLKVTVYAHPPVAVFGDLNTLCAAPRPMIAAGFGDILGKYTSLADWKLDRLFWDSPYDEAIAQRTRVALEDVARRTEEIGQATPAGIHSLMEALIESGLCMVDFGLSHPASGSEHYLSHFWETMLLQQGRPAILHGAKVGVGCIMIARFYQQIRQLNRQKAAELLAKSQRPDPKRDEETIRSAYGPIADKIIAEQSQFLNMTEEDFAALKQQILDNWDKVQAISATVPSPQHLAGLLATVGGPVDTAGLGLSDAERDLALKASHFFRNRFTVVKLCRVLGLVE